MRFNRAVTALAVLAPLVAGCKAASDDYPSLALRPAEVTGTFEVPPPDPYVPPPTPAAVVGQLDRLAADAAGAHRAFLAEAPSARGLVSAARGDEAGSEDWARAQVALAGLEAARSRAMIALADLDRLYVDAAVEGAELQRIAAVRDQVIAQVEEQNTTIDGLVRTLR